MSPSRQHSALRRMEPAGTASCGGRRRSPIARTASQCEAGSKSTLSATATRSGLATPRGSGGAEMIYRTTLRPRRRGGGAPGSHPGRGASRCALRPTPERPFRARAGNWGVVEREVGQLQAEHRKILRTVSSFSGDDEGLLATQAPLASRCNYWRRYPPPNAPAALRDH